MAMKRMAGVALAAALWGLAGMGQTAEGPAKKAPRRLTPEIKAMLIARTGGMVVQRGEGPEFVFANAQKTVAGEALKKVPEELEKVLNFPFAMREAELKGGAIAGVGGLLDAKTAAVVAVVDEPGLPCPTLVAAEERWGVVNVAALRADGAGGDKLAARVRKQMWRTFAVLMGAANNIRYGCLMKTVTSLKELDDQPYETVSPEPFSHICRTMVKFGMKRNRSATYRKAYLEGWAPPPETEVQKKIVADEEAKKKAGVAK